MNKLTITLRAASDPEIRDVIEENPTFVTVFSIHNTTKRNGEQTHHTMPLVAKFHRNLAKQAIEQLGKGCSFLAEGKLSYYKDKDSGKEYYSLIVEQFSDVQLPKNLQGTKAEVCHE